MAIEKIGPYRLGERLGKHSRHQVFAAVHETTGEQIAIKLVNITSKVDREIAVKKIELEARMLKRLNHPNLVRIIDANIEGDQLYFVMERVECETLASLLSRRGKLAWDQVVDYCLQVAQGLEYLHDQDLLHLKVTPDKILITEEGRVKLTDMRLNRARKRRWDDSGNRVLDTAAYLSPEQLAAEDVSPKCDMYSLGIIMFEAISGKLPFAPDTMARLIQRKRHLSPPSVAAAELEVPVWVDRLIAQLIHGDPARRPHTMHAVVLSLQEAQKMEVSRMSVAQRAAKGFNTVTMGKDSDEARRLLGMNPQEQKARDYSTPLLAIALLVVVLTLGIGIGWALMPPKPEALLAEAKELVAAGDLQSLLMAQRDCLKPLLERVSSGTLAEEATELMDLSEARIAGFRIEFDLENQRPPRSRAQRQCMDAWQLEEEEKFDEAWLAYYQAANEMSDEVEEADRGFYLFASLKQLELGEQLASQAGAKEQVDAQLTEILKQLETEREQAMERLEMMIAKFGEAPSMSELMDPAKAYLDKLKSESSASTTGDSDPVDSNASDTSDATAEPNATDDSDAGSSENRNLENESDMNPPGDPEPSANGDR